MLTKQEKDISYHSVKKWSETKKFNESHTIQNKPGRNRSQRFQRKFLIKLVIDASKDPRTIAKTLVNELDKSEIVVQKKTIIRALHRNGPNKNYLSAEKTHFKPN